jgi:hypothetical protein
MIRAALVGLCALAFMADVPARIFEHQYDRNALVTARPVGAHLLALTEAGSLLRFDRRTLALGGELLAGRAAVVLGGDERRALVGFASGRIARIDPDTFALADVAEVPGRPVFVGQDGGRPLVVFARPILAPYGRGPWSWGHKMQVRPLGGKWRAAVAPATAFLIDRRHRLWLGSDHGEFGGSVQMVRLDSGRVQDIPWNNQGVYGFVERPNGEVWAFGGTAHMGSARSYMARVEPGRPPAAVYELGLHAGRESAEGMRSTMEKQPVGPISHVIEEPGGRLLVLASQRVYETDAAMSAWKLLGKLAIDGPPGRPDAVGSYPAVRTAALIDGKLLLATVEDGLVQVDPQTGEMRGHRLAGQLELQPRAVVPAAKGAFVEGREEDPVAWTGSSLVAATAPFQPLVEKPKAAPRWKRGWSRPRFLPRADGAAVVVAKWGDLLSRGTVHSGSREDVLVAAVVGGAELVRERTEIEPDQLFALGDELWAYRGGLWQAKGGRFQRRSEGGSQGGSLDGIERAVARLQGGWIVLGRDRTTRVLLSLLPLRTPVEMSRLEIEVNGQQAVVHDAVGLDDGRLLVATSFGVVVHDRTSGRTKMVTGDVDVHRLARDGRGRVWMAGRGFWLLEGLARPIAVDAALPFVRDTDVLQLAARDERLYLALGNRGAAEVDADALAGVALAGTLPSRPEDRPRLHETRFAQAVFLDLRASGEAEQRQWRKRFEEATHHVLEALSARGLHANPADDGNRWMALELYTDDASAVIGVLEKVLRAEGLWDRALVTKRPGPQGTPEILVSDRGTAR